MRHIFGYPGDGINGVFGALNRAHGKVRFVQARHEEMAAFMASAYAKFSGRLGVCIATSGPGAAHLTTGLYDALMDHQPMLAIVLVDELVGLGHDVTLFASGDPRTKGKLQSVWPRALRLGRKGVDPNAACALLLEAIARRANDFDVIHAHIDWLSLPLLSRLGVPFLTTMHGRLDLPGLDEVIREFPQACFVAISDDSAGRSGARTGSTIQHGLPADLFRPSYVQGNIFSAVSRWRRVRKTPSGSRARPENPCVSLPRYLAPRAFTSKTGLSLASTARTSSWSGRSMMPRSSRSWPRLRPSCSPSLGRSRSVLVMIEAMACGTPVIAYRSGSVPEVIEDGVTGFIVENEEHAVAAVHRLDRLDRRKIRARFEELFSAHRMAKEYESKYRKLMVATPGTSTRFESIVGS